MSTLISSVLTDLLDSTDLDRVDKAYMKDTIEECCDQKRENYLARRILRSVISYYEIHKDLTKIESRVVAGLLASLEDIAIAAQPTTAVTKINIAQSPETPTNNTSKSGDGPKDFKNLIKDLPDYDAINGGQIPYKGPKDSNSGKSTSDNVTDSGGTNHGAGNASNSSNTDFHADIASTVNNAVGGYGSKVIVSNLPKNMNKAQIENYFSDSVGNVDNVEVSYDPLHVSRGVATITFSESDSASKAFAALHGIRLGRVPMTVHIVPRASLCAPKNDIDNDTTSIDASEDPANGQSPHISSPTTGLASDEDLGVQNATDVLQNINTLPALSQTFVMPTKISILAKDNAYAEPLRRTNKSYTSIEDYSKRYPIASKLMLNSGWIPGAGLGPQGDGLTDPITSPDDLLNKAIKDNYGIGFHEVQVCAGKQYEESKINPKALGWQQLAKDPKSHDKTIREANNRSGTDQPFVLRSVQEISTTRIKHVSKPSKVHTQGILQPLEEENKFLTDPYLFSEGGGHAEFRFNG